MWGSDWPVLELAGDYQTWFEECYNYNKIYLTTSQQENIYSNNAVRIYNLTPTDLLLKEKPNGCLYRC